MQLTRSEIAEKLKEILAASGGETVADVCEDANLFSDLGITSVGMLYMVIAIEETFSIRFDDVGMNDFSTFRDVIDYIEKKLV